MEEEILDNSEYGSDVRENTIILREQITQAGHWAKVTSIANLVMVVISFINFISALSNTKLTVNNSDYYLLMLVLTLVPIIMNIVIWYRLLLYSQSIGHWQESGDYRDLNAAMSNLRGHFQWLGILIIGYLIYTGFIVYTQFL